MWDAPTFDDRQCTIDPQIERSSESIDWECNEPNMTPVSFDDYELSDAGHSNWSTQDSQDNESDDEIQMKMTTRKAKLENQIRMDWWKMPRMMMLHTPTTKTLNKQVIMLNKPMLMNSAGSI